jgi:hypothetical protein
VGEPGSNGSDGITGFFVRKIIDLAFEKNLMRANAVDFKKCSVGVVDFVTRRESQEARRESQEARRESQEARRESHEARRESQEARRETYGLGGARARWSSVELVPVLVVMNDAEGASSGAGASMTAAGAA